MALHVLKKIIISGDVVELYEYEKGYLKDYSQRKKTGGKGRKKDFKSNDYSDNRKQVLQRASTNLRRVINSNAGMYGKEFSSKFMTLTFDRHVTDIQEANYCFTKFIKRLNYKLFDTKKANLRYSAVIEFTENDRIHYHVIIYNMPYVPANELGMIWDNGFIKINRIDRVDNVGAYICKYMSKDNQDERLQGKKCYFNSRGLFKPIEITDKKRVETLTDALPLVNLRYSSNFENEYLGKINYYQFNTNYFNKAIPSNEWRLKHIKKEE